MTRSYLVLTQNVTCEHAPFRSSSQSQRKTNAKPSRQHTCTTKRKYPTRKRKSLTAESHAGETTACEPSWLDVMREDRTTRDAWARIRHRLKPNQQKDILRCEKERKRTAKNLISLRLSI